MNAKTIELHFLQSFPPACLNRDGNNSPKDCTFGGVRRARISSQCLKRATRQAESFAEIVGEAVASRSKLMRDRKILPYLINLGLSQEEAEKVADDFRQKLASNDKKSNQTSVGLYFGDEELFALLDAFRSGDSKWMAAGNKKSADVALFGRMLAEAKELNVDAASQVAHAIGTHRLSQEMDYWTAADDLKGNEDDAGAGMLGSAEFNASIFYRYACVSLPILAANLNGDEELVKRTVEAFLHASWDAIPSGKINGHAQFTPPFLALGVVRRKGLQLNLCNAFIEPARPGRDESLADSSSSKLGNHLDRMRKMIPVDEADYFLAYSGDSVTGFTNVANVSGYGELIESAINAL